MSKMMMSNSINNDDDINLESRQKRKNTHIYVVGWDMVNVFTLRLLIAIWGIFGVDEAHKSESSAGRPRTENENPSPPPGGRNRRLGPTAGHADIFWGSEAGQLGGEKNSKQSLYVSLVNLLSSLWSRGICADKESVAGSEVKYLRKRRGFGRFYARGKGAATIQRLPRRLRATLLQGTGCKDIDMVNAHPSIMVGVAQKAGVILKSLVEYCENPKAVRESLAKKLGVTYEEVKQELCALLYGRSLQTIKRRYGRRLTKESEGRFNNSRDPSAVRNIQKRCALRRSVEGHKEGKHVYVPVRVNPRS
eukprot:GHVQ01030365.1.p1 GENE.GHVQ01030365.1~~GHVQ01030365.1.p1  ORF type:complete len:306 (+),score=38.78 GHVQ01030365.1:344-1261(+)